MLILIMLISLSSCRKGDGDPFFSLLTRKERLTGEWKVSHYAKSVKFKNKEYYTAYDGVEKRATYIIDSTMSILFPAPHDSSFQYAVRWTYEGNIYMDFDKSGTYNYTENLRNVSNGVNTSLQSDGFWYFTGGNKNSGYKNKELLALQELSNTFSPSAGYSSSITYSGENKLLIYEIYSLKSKEIELYIQKEEVINSITYTTIVEMTLTPR